MKTVVGKRSQYQLDVIKDSIPEAVINASTHEVCFPSSVAAAIERVREARKGVKGTGPSNALGAIVKALVTNDPNVVVEIAAAGDPDAHIPAKPAKPAKAPRAKKVVPTSPDGLCLCGCGEKVSREFKPGHDARYKGQLVRTALAMPSDLLISKEEALAIISERNWGAFVEKSRKALEAKAERKAKNPSSVKKGSVVGGPTVNLKQLAEAKTKLMHIGRYGTKAGDRQIEVHPADIPGLLDGTHPAYTDEDKVELGFVTAS